MHRLMISTTVLAALLCCGSVLRAQTEDETARDSATSATSDDNQIRTIRGADGQATTAARASARSQNRWRYRRHLGDWWYWSPNNQWLIWRDGNWIRYDRRTYQPSNRYYDRDRYFDDYYSRRYDPYYGRRYDPYYERRYYSGYRGAPRTYYDSYGRPYYRDGAGRSYYYDRGGRAGAGVGGAIGEAIGGDRGGRIGEAIGGAIGSDRD